MSDYETAIVEGKYLAARVHDMTLIEGAIEAQLENMEVLVGLWDEAATDDSAEGELETKTRLSRTQISRWRTALNDDRRRRKFASELFVAAYSSLFGLTRCQARAALVKLAEAR
jgi:hypothetical protein